MPFFLLKNKKRQAIGLRLGIYPEELIERLNAKGNIWIHAVSVGEVKAVTGLIERLRNIYPCHRVVITTVTETGNAVAKRLRGDDDIVLFLPFDIRFIVNRTLSYIKPSILIIVETELWPNLISQAYRDNIPVVLVNGRISDRSYKRYSLIKCILRPILKKITLFVMQTQEDKERILSLGADSTRVETSGNLKFDSASLAISNKKEAKDLSSLLGLEDDKRLIIAGSTHPGEEEVIISVYRNLLGRFNDIRLLIAPRHIERNNMIIGMIERKGFKPLLFSKLSTIDYQPSADIIFILDTIGQLKDFYSIADIVFVGGSLIKKGGQNIIEPATFAKPIIFGPYTFNFRDIASIFLKNEAAIIIRDGQHLEQVIAQLLEDPDMCKRMGQRAKGVVETNKGASDITLRFIDERISL